MVNFRPHVLKAVISTEDVEDPLTGQITPGTETTIEFPCRVSPNGGSKKIIGQDGVSVEYGYLIHAGKGGSLVPYGTEVKVFEGDNLKAKGKVINCFSNSMNTRLWI